MTAALIGLAGVVLGAVIKTVLDIALENRRWGREDQLRYFQQRLEAYAGFLRVLSAMHIDRKEPAEPPERRPDFGDLLGAYYLVDLLASQPVRVAATKCLLAAGLTAVELADLGEDHPWLGYSGSDTGVEHATAFREAARAELGLPPWLDSLDAARERAGRRLRRLSRLAARRRRPS
jgi:hypothetical protein